MNDYPTMVNLQNSPQFSKKNFIKKASSSHTSTHSLDTKRLGHKSICSILHTTLMSCSIEKQYAILESVLVYVGLSLCVWCTYVWLHILFAAKILIIIVSCPWCWWYQLDVECLKVGQLKVLEPLGIRDLIILILYQFTPGHYIPLKFSLYICTSISSTCIPVCTSRNEWNSVYWRMKGYCCVGGPDLLNSWHLQVR